MGGVLSRAEFCRCLVVAEAQVDAATFGRVRRDFFEVGDADELAYIGKLRVLVFELVGICLLTGGRQVVGESSDGLSLTFANEKSGEFALRRSGLIADMLRGAVDLSGVPLLYVGVTTPALRATPPREGN